MTVPCPVPALAIVSACMIGAKAASMLESASSTNEQGSRPTHSSAEPLPFLKPRNSEPGSASGTSVTSTPYSYSSSQPSAGLASTSQKIRPSPDSLITSAGVISSKMASTKVSALSVKVQGLVSPLQTVAEPVPPVNPTNSDPSSGSGTSVSLTAVSYSASQKSGGPATGPDHSRQKTSPEPVPPVPISSG